MSYTRVIPRDLFNEAGLLKAVGRVVILLGENDGHQARIMQDQVEFFDVVQNDGSGDILIANINFEVDGKEWHLERPLNSRESWSLWARDPDDIEEEVEVFTEDGNFTEDMRRLIGLDAYTPGKGF